MQDEAAIIRKLVAAHRIAIVGLSDDPSRPSYRIASYLLHHGKEIVPVNPNCREVLAQICYPSLHDIPGQIDLVDVFRRPEFCADVTRDAIAIHAGGIWLQSGIISAEARKLAESAKIPFVEDRCLMVEHRLINPQ